MKIEMMISIGICFVLLMLLSIFRDKLTIRAVRTLLLIIVSCIYVFSVTQITLLSREIETGRSILLIPFNAYYMMLTVGWTGWGEYIFYGLFANTVLFIPAGMIIAQLPKVQHPYLLSGLIGFAVSLSIEMTQYFTMLGTFEVDDLIQNTWGVVIGCAIALALMKKEKSVKVNLKTLMPLVSFLLVLGSVSVAAMLTELIRTEL